MVVIQSEKFYSVPEVSRLLDVSQDTVWSWLRCGRLLKSKIAGRVAIRESAIAKLVTDCPVEVGVGA